MATGLLTKDSKQNNIEVNEVILKRLFHYLTKYKQNKDGMYECNIDTISSYLSYIEIIRLDDFSNIKHNNSICKAYLEALIENKYFNKTTTKVYWNSSRRGSYKLCRKLGSKGRSLI